MTAAVPDPKPLEYEEVRPERPYARRKVKVKTPSGYDVSGEAIAAPIPNSLSYGPFELVGHIAINRNSHMVVSCEATQINELIRILRSMQALGGPS